jgi:hypothetical protein
MVKRPLDFIGIISIEIIIWLQQFVTPIGIIVTFQMHQFVLNVLSDHIYLKIWIIMCSNIAYYISSKACCKDNTSVMNL